MFFRLQLFYAFAALILTVLYERTVAEVAMADSNTMNNLYDNVLQREYAGPVVFPNHQVERKAQRSPSLRLRFGRRSDPDMLVVAPEKRWFGDVNQKPIRSPSLRLRFGRRSDPSMPLHSSFDELMNDLTTADTADNGVNVASNAVDDYADMFDDTFDRVVRKPQRLRWGRSVPYKAPAEEDFAMDGDLKQRYDDLFTSLLNSDKLRQMLLALRQYEDTENALIDAGMEGGAVSGSGEFQREVRKPAPLRLRWGRSTGGRSANQNGAAAAGPSAKAQQKKAISAEALPQRDEASLKDAHKD